MKDFELVALIITFEMAPGGTIFNLPAQRRPQVFPLVQK